MGVEPRIDTQSGQSSKGALPRALGSRREVDGRVEGLSKEERSLGEERKGYPGENVRGAVLACNLSDLKRLVVWIVGGRP